MVTALLAAQFEKMAKDKKYWHKWIVDDAIIEIVNVTTPNNCITFSVRELNMLLARTKPYKSVDMLVNQQPNIMGLYKSIKQMTTFC